MHNEIDAVVLVIVLLVLVNTVAGILLMLLVYRSHLELIKTCAEVKGVLLYVVRRKRQVDEA